MLWRKSNFDLAQYFRMVTNQISKLVDILCGVLLLTHGSRDDMAAISQTCILLDENVWISLKFVPNDDLINNVPALFQIMTWRRPGDKPLSGAMMVFFIMNAYMRHSASMS